MSEFAYFGTPYVSRDTLEILQEHGLIPEVIVTAPDAQRGRGLVLTPSETKEWALAHGIPVLTPTKITDDVIQEIGKYDCEYALVVAYGKILPETLIQSFPQGVLNIHYSLLPKYRGASPVEAALLHNEKTTGVTIQKMVYELDAGDILAQEETEILPYETTRELRRRLIRVGAELLARILPEYLAGNIIPVPQDHTQSTHSSKIKKEEGELFLDAPARENWNTYRAYAESPGTYFFVERAGKRLRVKIVSATYQNDTFIPERVIPEGKKEMAYADFIRGV